MRYFPAHVGANDESILFHFPEVLGQHFLRRLQILVTWSADYSEPPSDGISDRKAVFSESESHRQCDSPAYRAGIGNGKLALRAVLPRKH